MLRLGKRLWQILSARQRKRVVLLAGAVIVTAILEVVNVSAIAPFLALASDPSKIQEHHVLASLYDLLGFDNASDFLVAVGIAIFLLMVISNAWSAITTWAQLRLVWSWNHQLSVRLLERYLYRPYSYFLSQNSADLAKNLLAEVQQVTNSAIRPVILSLGKAVVSLGIITVLVVVNPTLAVSITFVVGGIYAAIYMATRQRLNLIGRDRVKANKERFTSANEALGGIKEVKVLNAEAAFLKRFDQASRQFSRHQATGAAIGTIPRYAIEAVAFSTVILIVVYLVRIESDFSGIVPMLGLYAFAGYRLMPAFQQVFSGITAMRFSKYALEAVLDDLEVDVPEPASRQAVSCTHQPAVALRRQIELRNITFVYPNSERPALRNVSITIPANSTIGFVGATGSGKTTLADIVLGLLRPQSGEILVDGIVITDDNLSAWQANVGYVPQHIFLTDASVAENIAFGIRKEDIDMDAVRTAAKIAQIDEFVMTELPHGYDTVVGERGIRLSGGQRQRIGIARALYRNPSVIVFDEATSALDNETEEHLMAALQALYGNKTLIMIAHRVSTLRSCDTIYVVEKGRILAQGSFSDLFPRGKLSVRSRVSRTDSRMAVSNMRNEG